jgi:hypothetical protein
MLVCVCECVCECVCVCVNVDRNKYFTLSLFQDHGPRYLSPYSDSLRESNTGVGEISHIRPDRPLGATKLLYIAYRIFGRGEAARAWR